MGNLISKVDYPVTVQYNGHGMRVAPRSVVKRVNSEKLGDLPKGLVFIKQ